MKDEAIYEPPALAEVGDFAETTLSDGTWGWDDVDQCWFLGC